MDYVNLGASGMKVSRICLGCMSFGQGSDWMVDEADSQAQIKKALDAGINFFDTANAYSRGKSEEILGRALREFKARREEMVVATKVFFPMTSGPNTGGLSRKNIFQSVDASLKRLDMDYIDLYQIHRYDYETPLEETIEALNDVVRMGKALYIGASSMFSYQFATMRMLQQQMGAAQFVSMQNHYNLLYREEEREMNQYCEEEGVGLIPWSPLAGGVLARGDANTTRS